MIELNSDTIFERQGEKALSLYLLLDGEVGVFNQPDALIKHNGIVSSSKIPLW